ncbi:hypothetical protein FH972_012024 [Carpinus fangiana]|uniref:Fatty acid hydroxylase domain-containing protein n=1 Tax=Carpinus fangiana TaxID=176857 RepID=A0A5N6R422_9ROSI|nr:hypothetical protein FH972_012024 [Carpinus fangiana]
MLPYQTLEEAAAAMGRNLTYAETLWFNYSADKSDYFLYCHNTILLFFIYSVVPLPMVFLELARVDRYKIQPKARMSVPEIFRSYRDTMLNIGIRTGLPLPSVWEVLAQLVVYFIVEDYTNYWIHRFLHTKWGYEKIHRVHHEYTAPVGFTALYAHWAEIWVLGFPSIFGPAIAPGHMITYWLWMALRHIESIENHSGYDFPWNPTKYIPFYGGADYHDYHHYVGQHSKSNFSPVFTYCDYIYGTDKGYRVQKRLFQKMKDEMKTGGDQNGGSYHNSTQDLKSD